jgi:putative membrane protein
MDSHQIFNKIQVFVLCAVVSSSAVLVAQAPTTPRPGQTPADSMPGATTTQDSGIVSDTPQGIRDRTFLRQASEGGLAEIQFGKLAAEKGTSDDVRSFGQKMVDDHTKLNQQLVPIADSMGVTVPKHLNKEHQAEYEKLSALSGDAFDKEYIAIMVKEHHADLRDFRTVANGTTDPSLKQALADGANVIHDHMVMIDKIAHSKGVATPAGKGKPE